MSELKEVKFHEMNAIKLGLRNDKLYFKSEADKVIAEKDKEIARLEAMRKVHVEAIASMEDRLHQDEKKIRRLKRALWLARAERAKDNAIRYGIYGPAIKSLLWSGVDAKCLAKAEEYR